MNQEQGKQERLPYNLRTNYEETFKAIASIEDKPKSRWLVEQAEDMADIHTTSVPNALRWLHEHPAEKKGFFEIYGDGGVNRWRVYRNGRVVYFLDEESKTGTIEDAVRARALGFEVEGKTGPTRNPHQTQE